MTNQKESPSLIMMLAPTAVLLIVYGYGFHIPRQKELQSATRRLDLLSKDAEKIDRGLTDNFGELASVNKEVRQVKAELVEEQITQQQLESDRTKLLQQVVKPTKLASTMNWVGDLLEEHSLSVIESGEAKASQKLASKQVTPLVNLLTTNEQRASLNRTLEQRKAYRIQFRGRYQDLQAAMQALSEESGRILPLALEMEKLDLEASAASQPERVWTLTFLV